MKHTNLAQASLLFLLFISCTNQPSPKLEDGLRPEYQGFIPASIAVWSCQVWPSLQHDRFDLGTKPTEMNLCESIDRFVIESFHEQPLVRGHSPQAIKEMMKSKRSTIQPEDLSSWDLMFKTMNPSGLKAAPFYRRHLEHHAPWQEWLRAFSNASDYSDAILIPFITSQSFHNIKDRGLNLSRYSLGFTLFLIDTNTGHLIWTRHNHRLILQPPSVEAGQKLIWDSLKQSILRENIWQDFPGRLQKG